MPFAARRWHTLSLSVNGTAIAGSVDGTPMVSAIDGTLTDGMPGIEVGGWYPAYLSNLNITSPKPDASTYAGALPRGAAG